jgi:hypothetical protein
LGNSWNLFLFLTLKFSGDVGGNAVASSKHPAANQEMVALAEMRAYASELYDNEKRPALVEKALRLAGAEAALNKIGVVNGSADKVVTAVAAMTTVAGLLEKKAAAIEIAAPYIAKARDADGRKELRDEIVSLEIVQDGKTYVQEKVVEPISARLDKSKELAAPYVASAKEYADPYVAKLAELRKSERVESMVAAFQQVRTAHPSVTWGDGGRGEATVAQRAGLRRGALRSLGEARARCLTHAPALVASTPVQDAAFLTVPLVLSLVARSLSWSQAREHPAEKAAELRATAVDLISYDNLRTYRDHVMSAEFQADTIQLVKVRHSTLVAPPQNPHHGPPHAPPSPCPLPTPPCKPLAVAPRRARTRRMTLAPCCVRVFACRSTCPPSLLPPPSAVRRASSQRPPR